MADPGNNRKQPGIAADSNPRGEANRGVLGGAAPISRGNEGKKKTATENKSKQNRESTNAKKGLAGGTGTPEP